MFFGGNMKKVLLVPSLDWTALDADNAICALEDKEISATLCRENTCLDCINLVVVILGNSNNPRMAIRIGVLAREQNIPIVYAPHQAKTIVEKIEEAFK